MRVVVIGMRGFPDVQGGIEIHCQNLYPRLGSEGLEVTVFGRKQYIGNKRYTYKNVSVIPIWSPKSKYMEAIVHTFVGLVRGLLMKPDLIHFHATGPSIFVPVAKMLGLKVVATHHGFDYQRDKWGRVAKAAIKKGEKNMCAADAVISISSHIRNFIKEKFECDSVIIPNGVEIPERKSSIRYCSKWGIKKSKYILYAGRLVPEKNVHDLIEAFSLINTDWKLVIAGKADHEDSYFRSLREKAQEVARVVMTGFLTGEELREIFSNAGCFVLPSSHEGLPIALLEALSYGLPCIASDIPANREIRNESIVSFFPVHDIQILKNKIIDLIENAGTVQKSEAVEYVRRHHNWDMIAQRTLEVYKGIFERTGCNCCGNS